MIVLANGLSHRIQQPMRWLMIPNDGQCFQVSGIGLTANFDPSIDIGHAFAYRNPRFGFLPMAMGFAIHFETSWVVNCGLDPQNTSLFVVHFDRVLFNPVFDPGAFWAFADFALDFTVKTAIGLSAEKTQHVFTAKLINSVADQDLI